MSNSIVLFEHNKSPKITNSIVLFEHNKSPEMSNSIVLFEHIKFPKTRHCPQQANTRCLNLVLPDNLTSRTGESAPDVSIYGYCQ